jgi:predicted MFS family arabinose efflux permease
MKDIRQLLLMIVLVQFVNAMDFVLVMPLGPDIAFNLGFETDKIAWLSASYTFAAAITALLLASLLDRYDRKHVMVFFLVGLLIGTLLAAVSTSLEWMIAARILSGIFGGPAIGIGMSIVADKVPIEERGKAVGLILVGFPLSGIFGIPIALYIGDLFGWQWAFYLLSGLIFLVIVYVWICMPNLAEHLSSGEVHGFQYINLIRRPEMGLGVFSIGIALFPGFLVIPHFSTILQLNNGFPREDLSVLLLVSGLINLAIVMISGRISDRIGSPKTNTAFVLLFSVNVFMWLVTKIDISVVVYYLMFSMCFSASTVPVSSLVSKIPSPQERAGFGTLLTLFQHVGAGLGAAVSYTIVVPNADGALGNLDVLGASSAAAALLTPFIVMSIDRRLKERLRA